MMNSEDSKSLSQQRFGEFAARYVTSQTHAEAGELDRLVEITQPQTDWLLLDIATGGGHTALKFAPLVARVTAVDIAAQMLQEAAAFIASKGSQNVTFALADAEDLPFDDGSFDLVTCRIAPHHFPGCARFVHEAKRVLRGPRFGDRQAGGSLLVQDNTRPEDPDAARYIDAFERVRDPSHNRAYAESEWLEMFQEAGLEVVHTEQILKVHKFITWAKRQGCTPEVMDRLVEMMDHAPGPVAEWMQPQGFGTAEAAFVDHHILIAGSKIDSGAQPSNVVPQNHVDRKGRS
jgi:ubiquinone/menaquinone biosynthesis C-methylase UbiE